MDVLTFSQESLNAMFFQISSYVHLQTLGGTPYIQMIWMIVIFLGVVIGYLVFLRDCSSKIY